MTQTKHTPTPWRMKKYTHEMVSPTGEIVARLYIYKNNQIALDDGNEIHRSGGSLAFGYHVGYNIKGRNTFPADDISGELHYFTANFYTGHTIRKAHPEACPHA